MCHHGGRSDFIREERQINDWNAEYRVKATEVRRLQIELMRKWKRKVKQRV